MTTKGGARRADYVPRLGGVMAEGRHWPGSPEAAGGGSQVRTDAAAETCFGLDALLLQLPIGGSGAATGELLLVVPKR